MAKLAGSFSPRSTPGDVALLEVGRLRRFARMVRAIAEHRGGGSRHCCGRSPGRRCSRCPTSIGRAVELVLEMERQPGQVDVIALEHDLAHRRVGRRHLHHRLRTRSSAACIRGSRCAHRCRRRGPAAGRLPDTAATISYCSAPTRLKHFRLRRRLDHRAQLGERDRLLVHLHLADLRSASRRRSAGGTCRGRRCGPPSVMSSSCCACGHHLARRIDHRVDAAGDIRSRPCTSMSSAARA